MATIFALLLLTLVVALLPYQILSQNVCCSQFPKGCCLCVCSSAERFFYLNGSSLDICREQCLKNTQKCTFNYTSSCQAVNPCACYCDQGVGSACDPSNCGTTCKCVVTGDVSRWDYYQCMGDSDTKNRKVAISTK